MQARSAVQCRSARVSAAVSPANNATFPIGSIVVQSVAKSLLILIRSGDICRSVCFILIPMTYQVRAKLLRSASPSSDSTLHVATASLVQTADQTRGKVGGVKWACAYIAPDDAPPTVPKK